MQVVVLPEPCNDSVLDTSQTEEESHLKTDKHDDVRFAFLGLVGLDPGVDKCDEFLKYCLLDDDSFVEACKLTSLIGLEISFTVTLSHFIKVNRLLDIVL